MNTSSVSLSALAAAAFTAMDEAMKFGKIAPSDVSKVEDAVNAGAKAPQTKQPFARKEMSGVPAGDWRHFVAALGEFAAQGTDRNALEAQKKTQTGRELDATEKKLRFFHFLCNSVRSAMFVAQRPAKSSNGHPQLDSERVKSLVTDATERNRRGDPSRGRRAQNPVEAKLTASRWVVGLILRASDELGAEKVQSLLAVVEEFAIEAFLASAHGHPSAKVLANAKAFMADAVQFHEAKLAEGRKPKDEKPAEQPVTYMQVAEAMKAEEAAAASKPATVETAVIEAAPASRPKRERRRVGHRVSPKDGTVEVLWAEVPV